MRELNDIDTSDNSTLDSLIEGFQLIGFDWRYLYVNKTVVKQSKLNTKKDLFGFTVMEKFPGIEKTELFKVLQKCMIERVSKTMDTEFIFPDNSKGWFELRIEPVPKGIFILSMDITERKKSETSFRESEEKYRLFFEHNLDAVFLTAPDGCVLNANPEAIRLLGYSLEELRQKGMGAIIDVNHPKLHSALLERKKTGKFKGELTLIRKDGVKLLCEISTVIYNNSDGLDRTHIIIKDITEKKKSEVKLKESLERFNLVTLATNEIIWDWDIIDNTIWWNEQYYSLMQLKKDKEYLNLTSWTNYIHPEDLDRITNSITKFLESKKLFWAEEYRFCNKEGKFFWFNDRGYLIRDQNGKPLRMIGAVTDITERKKNEEDKLHLREQLIFATEKERTRIGQDLHDSLVQSLVATSMYISVLKKTFDYHEEGMEMLTITSELLSKAMEETRSISHNLSGNISLYGIDKNLKEMIGFIHPSLKIKYSSNIAEIRFLEKIEVNIYRVIQEIINNTVKHAKATELKIKIQYTNNNLIISTKDNGIGFDIEKANKKMGIGLSGLRNRIAMITGELKIVTAPNKGTKYKIEVKNVEVLVEDYH